MEKTCEVKWASSGYSNKLELVCAKNCNFQFRDLALLNVSKTKVLRVLRLLLTYLNNHFKRRLN